MDSDPQHTEPSPDAQGDWVRRLFFGTPAVCRSAEEWSMLESLVSTSPAEVTRQCSGWR